MKFLVSYPRSGHHFLIKQASKIFPSLSYCRFYGCEDQYGQKLSCPAANYPEFFKYGCRAGKEMQKTHDFTLTLPIIKTADISYLALIRNPVDANISWYEMAIAEGNAVDSEEGFRSFMKLKLPFYAAFYRKWITSACHIKNYTAAKASGLHFCTYDELLQCPLSLENSLSWCLPWDLKRDLDLPALSYKIQSESIRPKRDRFRFRYFNINVINDVLLSNGFQPCAND
jgi:hypothetical protein